MSLFTETTAIANGKGDDTIKSVCCDAVLIKETDICSECNEHTERWYDREPNYNEMICPACGESITPYKEDNSFDYAGTHCTHGQSGTHDPGSGDPKCPKCDADVAGDDFDAWSESQEDY